MFELQSPNGGQGAKLDTTADMACCSLLWLEKPAGDTTKMRTASLLPNSLATQYCHNAGGSGQLTMDPGKRLGIDDHNPSVLRAGLDCHVACRWAAQGCQGLLLWLLIGIMSDS